MATYRCANAKAHINPRDRLFKSCKQTRMFDSLRGPVTDEFMCFNCQKKLERRATYLSSELEKKERVIEQHRQDLMDKDKAIQREQEKQKTKDKEIEKLRLELKVLKEKNKILERERDQAVRDADRHKNDAREAREAAKEAREAAKEAAAAVRKTSEEAIEAIKELLIASMMHLQNDFQENVNNARQVSYSQSRRAI